jgi:hypothetical protein
VNRPRTGLVSHIFPHTSSTLTLRRSRSLAWIAESFEVLNVEADRTVRVRFAFEAKGLDKKSKPSGDRIRRAASGDLPGIGIRLPGHPI